MGMKHWLNQIGHSSPDIDDLNVIHVAGTKGKGSTCAFANSFLSAYSERAGFPRKIGLYTSPHLVFPEERIRIDSAPIRRHLFAKYFFEVYDALSLHDTTEDTEAKPRYLQLFLLVALHAFVREGVEAAIVETHHGGEFDATNVIEKPVVTAIASLGMDHVAQLGPSIKRIAWHKAGIFKSGAEALSVPQEAGAAKALQARAAEKGVKLEFVDYEPSLEADEMNLFPRVQKLNCSLALAATRSFLSRKSPPGLPLLETDVLKGIKQFSWPGRFQVLTQGTLQWYLDGAHNEMSVVETAAWFAETSKRSRARANAPRILVFSQVSEQRDPLEVFRKLAEALQDVDIQYLMLTTYEPGQNLEGQNGTTPIADTRSVPDRRCAIRPDIREYLQIWERYQPGTSTSFESNVANAIEKAKAIGLANSGMQTLITGSQHLVGGALFHLQ